MLDKCEMEIAVRVRESELNWIRKWGPGRDSRPFRRLQPQPGWDTAKLLWHCFNTCASVRDAVERWRNWQAGYLEEERRRREAEDRARYGEGQ